MLLNHHYNKLEISWNIYAGMLKVLFFSPRYIAWLGLFGGGYSKSHQYWLLNWKLNFSLLWNRISHEIDYFIFHLVYHLWIIPFSFLCVWFITNNCVMSNRICDLQTSTRDRKYLYTTLSRMWMVLLFSTCLVWLQKSRILPCLCL